MAIWWEKGSGSGGGVGKACSRKSRNTRGAAREPGQGQESEQAGGIAPCWEDFGFSSEQDEGL